MARPTGLLVSAYYRSTWQVLILLTAAMALSANVVRPQVTLPFLATSLWLMTSFGARFTTNSLVVRRNLRLALGAAILLLISDEVLTASNLEDIVPALLETLCGVLAFQLVVQNKPRDYWLSILTTVVIVVGSITLATAAVIYLGFFAYIVVLLLNMNAACLRLPGDIKSQAEELPPSYFRQFAQAVPTGLVAGIAIFVLFPRVQSFTLMLGNLTGHSRTGYTGGVTLADGGTIDPSPTVVFFASASDRDWLQLFGPTLLFRGNSLSTFDGVKWTTDNGRFIARDREGELRLAVASGPAVDRLTIHMEPTTLNAIFYPGVLFDISTPAPATAGHLSVNIAGDLKRDSATMERYEYHVRIGMPQRLDRLPTEVVADYRAELLAAAPKTASITELTKEELDRYLQVPDALASADYFKAWRLEVGIDPQHENVAQALARLNRNFANKFQTSLANAFSGETALARFLGPDRSGHCEYFASASAMLLRSVGIPTRIVLGYKGGTYNRFIDMLEVREADAHAWVEVYVPHFGWREYDPTAAAANGPDAGSEVASTLRLYMDATSFWFREYVIDYDQTKQASLFNEIRTIGDHRRSGQKPFFDDLKEHGREVGFAAVALLSLFFGWNRWRRWRRLRVAGVPAYYLELLTKLRQVDVMRRPEETYSRFHARLAGLGFDDPLVAEAEAALEADLYGPQRDTVASRQDLRRRLKRLVLRPKRSA